MDSDSDISVINLHSSENDLESDSNTNAKSTPKKRKIVPIYKQSFNEHWLQDVELKDWLKKTDDPLKALCSYCDIAFSAPKKCDLLHHKQTNKHESNVAAAKKSTKVTQFFSKANKAGKHFSKKVATAELQLASFIVEHELPFAAANHLVEIVKKIGQLHPSVQKGITLKKTKATYTIVEGIGREESLDIIDVLKNQTFSIPLDENTDVSVTQMLALVVRYVNANTMQTVDRCFDIIEVLDGTSLGLFKAVSNVPFEKHSIPPKNLIGLGADNCATMMGKVSGFQAQLKEACPHIFVNGCICHSLALRLSHASKKLPAWIENLIRDICSYFSHWSKRKQKFENIQKLCDAPRHAILKIAQTRWLSHQQVVERILEQWESLNTFFQQ